MPFGVAALTSQLREECRVVVIFLGDGAMEAGVVHESLNFAVLKKLPSSSPVKTTSIQSILHWKSMPASTLFIAISSWSWNSDNAG